MIGVDSQIHTVLSHRGSQLWDLGQGNLSLFLTATFSEHEPVFSQYLAAVAWKRLVPGRHMDRKLGLRCSSSENLGRGNTTWGLALESGLGFATTSLLLEKQATVSGTILCVWHLDSSG